MRFVINTILFLVVIALCYFLYQSIYEPIRFKGEKDKREKAVIQKLRSIREAQNMYLDITGEYARNFDTLRHVLRNGKFMFINIEGDPDDPNSKDFNRDTSYKNAIDSVRAIGLNLDSLHVIPYGGGRDFSIYADTIEYQSTLVNVIEVAAPYKSFMGPFASPSYSKYDNLYDPEKLLKFGDRNAPNTSGNWER